MARKRNGDAAQDVPREIMNGAARQAVIRDGFAAIHDIEDDIARLTETHIKPLKEARAKKWRELKADVNIPRRELRPAYDQYKLMADAMGDADADFDLVLDNCREIHQSLGIGESVDWVRLLSGGYEAEGEAAA